MGARRLSTLLDLELDPLDLELLGLLVDVVEAREARGADARGWAGAPFTAWADLQLVGLVDFRWNPAGDSSQMVDVLPTRDGRRLVATRRAAAEGIGRC